ncbi:MAG: tetratricopeptide repeat protein [Acidobacteriota bacterium]
MHTHLMSAICLILVLSFRTSAQDLIPVNPTSEQDSLFKAAIALYDQGAYDDAVRIYASILEKNPAFVAAIAELSLTYNAAQKYEYAVATALKGLKFKSGYRADLYLNLGNAYDMLGRTDEAIDAYRIGLALIPNSYLLHYNLGLTFMRSNRPDSARIHLQSALRSKPSHASSNLALGTLYRSLGKRIPAVFAYSRFLIIEPNSARSASTAALLRSLLSDSMSIKQSNPGEMTVLVSPDSDGIDGDVTSLGISLAMTQASRLTKDSAFDSYLASLAADLSSFFQITSEIIAHERGSGFIWNYYAPYFAELHSRGFTDIAVRLMFRSTDKEEALDFLRTRVDAIENFKSWNATYDWTQ